MLLFNLKKRGEDKLYGFDYCLKKKKDKSQRNFKWLPVGKGREQDGENGVRSETCLNNLIFEGLKFYKVIPEKGK